MMGVFFALLFFFWEFRSMAATPRDAPSQLVLLPTSSPSVKFFSSFFSFPFLAACSFDWCVSRDGQIAPVLLASRTRSGCGTFFS